MSTQPNKYVLLETTKEELRNLAQKSPLIVVNILKGSASSTCEKKWDFASDDILGAGSWNAAPENSFAEVYKTSWNGSVSNFQKTIAKILDGIAEFQLKNARIVFIFKDSFSEFEVTALQNSFVFLSEYKNFAFSYKKEDSLENQFVNSANALGTFTSELKSEIEFEKVPAVIHFCFMFAKGVENINLNPIGKIAEFVGHKLAQNINWARRISELPGNALTPEKLVIEASNFLDSTTQKNLIQKRILKKVDLETEGFGGVLFVGKGSENPPCVGVFFRPSQAKPKNGQEVKTVALIGKGITFDTGGYSIKPKQFHNEMKFDMCGAVNIVAAFARLVEQRLDLNILCIIGCAENMVSQTAGRPGDVYKAYNGKTVDVYNTDAEGRLVLADLFGYAAQYKPNYLLDLATLTGGTASIAGNLAGVLMGNEESDLKSFKEAGKLEGEPWISLEILPECAEDMKGTVSDYTNMNNKWSSNAATMHAASFLKQFLPSECSWLHLDIASMAYKARAKTVYGEGANGFGAATITRWVSQL